MRTRGVGVGTGGRIATTRTMGAGAAVVALMIATTGAIAAKAEEVADMSVGSRCLIDPRK